MDRANCLGFGKQVGKKVAPLTDMNYSQVAANCDNRNVH